MRHEQRLRLTGTLSVERHQLIQIDAAAGSAFCERCLAPVRFASRTNNGRVERRCPQSERGSKLRADYGISLEQYREMVAAANGLCEACGQRPYVRHGRVTLHVDHDHATGAVRGLLCQPCNLALGHLGDDLDRIERLAAYLRRVGQPESVRSE